MTNYQDVAWELMVVERTACWNPRGLFGTRNAHVAHKMDQER